VFQNWLHPFCATTITIAMPSNSTELVVRQFCEQCGQTVSNIRYGVRLTPLKARIFDAIARAGVDGIATCDLFDVVFANDSRRHSVRTLKSHVWQINQRLRGTGLHIYGRRLGLRLMKVSRPSGENAPACRQFNGVVTCVRKKQ
jgi:hypothetical protein